MTYSGTPRPKNTSTFTFTVYSYGNNSSIEVLIHLNYDDIVYYRVSTYKNDWTTS